MLSKILNLCANGAVIEVVDEGLSAPADCAGMFGQHLIILLNEWWLNTGPFVPGVDYYRLPYTPKDAGQRVLLPTTGASYLIGVDDETVEAETDARNRCLRRVFAQDIYKAALGRAEIELSTSTAALDLSAWRAIYGNLPVPSLDTPIRPVAVIDAVEINGVKTGRLVIARGEADFTGPAILGTLAGMWLSDTNTEPEAWLKNYAESVFNGTLLKNVRAFSTSKALSEVAP
jgi:hypothetical protein